MPNEIRFTSPFNAPAGERSLSFPPPTPPLAPVPEPAFTPPAEDLAATAEAEAFKPPQEDLDNTPFAPPETDVKRTAVVKALGDMDPKKLAEDKSKIPDIKHFYNENADVLSPDERTKLAEAHVARKDAGIGGIEVLRAGGNFLNATWDLIKGGVKAGTSQQEFLKRVAHRIAIGDEGAGTDKEIANSLLKPAGELAAGTEAMAVNLVGVVRGLIKSQVNQEGTRFVLGKLGLDNAAPRATADIMDPGTFFQTETPVNQLINDAGLSKQRENLAVGEGTVANFFGIDASAAKERGIEYDPSIIAFNSMVTDPTTWVPVLQGLRVASVAGKGFSVVNAAGQTVAKTTTREAAQQLVQRAAAFTERQAGRLADRIGGIGRGPVAQAAGVVTGLSGPGGLTKVATAWVAKEAAKKGVQGAGLAARAAGSEIGSRAIVAGVEGGATGAGIGVGLAASTNDPQEQADLIAMSGGLGTLAAGGGTLAAGALSKVRRGVQQVVNRATSAKDGLLAEIPPTNLELPGLENLEQMHRANRDTLVSEQERRIGDYNRALLQQEQPPVIPAGDGTAPPVIEQGRSSLPLYYLTEEQAVALNPGLAGKEGATPVTITDANGNRRQIMYVNVDQGRVTGNVHEPAHFWFDNLLDEAGKQELLGSFSDKQVENFQKQVDSNSNYTPEQRKRVNARLELAVEAFGHQMEGRGLEGLPQSLKDKMIFLAAQGLERIGAYTPESVNARPNAAGNVTRGGVEVPTQAAKVAREALNEFLNDPAVKADMDARRAQAATPPVIETPAAPGAPPTVVPVVRTPEQAQDELVAAIRRTFAPAADRYETILAKHRRGETLTVGEQAQFDSIVAEAARLEGARPVPAPVVPEAGNPDIVPAPRTAEPPVIRAPEPTVRVTDVDPADAPVVRPAPTQPELTPTTPAQPAANTPANVRGVTPAAYKKFVGVSREPAQQRARSAVNAIAKDPNLSPEVVAANKQLLENLGVPHEIIYDSAAETGSKNAESYKRRRQEVEAARNNPDLRAAASKFGVIPLDVNQIADGHQLQVWSGDAALVNIDRVLKQTAGKAREALIPYPMKDGKLVDGGAQLADDLVAYTQNQNNGYKGDGSSLNRPANPQGFIPDVNPEYRPVKLTEDVANFANLLMGERPPKIARVTPGVVPVQVRAKAIAEANKRAGVETGPIFKAPYEGTAVKDYNPLRVAMEKAGFDLKDLNPVHERLNVDRIKGAKPRPDITLEPTATDVTAAGFMAKPNEAVRGLADEFMRGKGRTYKNHATIVRPSRETLREVADAYAAAKDSPNDPKVQKSYNAFADEITEQWQYLKDQGYTFEIWDKPGQPYKNAAEMAADVRDNKHLYTFDSVSPESSPEITAGNPMFRKASVKIGDREVLVNDLFRQIHDVFGHAQNGFSFGPQGEWNAFLAHSRMFSPEARSAMQTETVGQNAWVNYGPHVRNKEGGLLRPGDEGFQIRRARPFAEQKAVLLDMDVSGADFMAKSNAGKRAEESGFKFTLTKNPESGLNILQIVDPDLGNVGFIQFDSKGDTGKIKMVNVDHHMQGQGLGELLYKEALTHLQEAGVTKVTGDVVHDAPMKIRRKLLGEPKVSEPIPGIGNREVPFVTNELNAEMRFMPKPEEDAIKMAAVKLADGSVFTGRFHIEALDKAIEAGKDVNGGITDGFVTNSGEFLNREDALNRAVELEQITRSEYEANAARYEGAPKADYLETENFQESRNYMAKRKANARGELVEEAAPTPKKFWLESGSEVKDAQGDHGRFAAKEQGVEFNQDKRGEFESAKMATGAIRGNRQDGVLFLDGDRPWKDLSRRQRDRIQDIAFETGDAVNYNGKFIDGFGPDDGGNFMAKKKSEDRFAKYNVKREPPKVNPTGWIQPDGKYEPLVAAYHEQDLAQSADYYNKKFGTSFDKKAVLEGRQDALDAGFVRMRSNPNGDMAVEVSANHWDKQRKAIKRQLLANADRMNRLSISVLNSKGKVIADAGDNIFMAKDAERTISDVVDDVKLPGGEASKEPTLIQRARALPEPDYMAKRNNDEQFPTLSWVKPDGSIVPVSRDHAATATAEFGGTVAEARQAAFDAGWVRVAVGKDGIYVEPAQTTGTEFGQKSLTRKQLATLKDAAIEGGHGKVIQDRRGYGDRVLFEVDAPDFMAKPDKNQLEFGKPVPAIDRYDRAKIQSMTPKQLKEHWPEAIVGKEGPIGSDLVDSPLVKEFGLEEGAKRAGDKLVARVKAAESDPDMLLGKTWYSRFHKPLRQFFGDDAQVFTEFLAATSPQTQPKQNFETAWEAFRLYKTGWFDDLVNGFKQGLDKVNDGSLLKEYQRKVPKAEQPEKISDSTLLRWWIDEKDLKPTKAPRLNKDAAIEDSVMFNSQSVAVLKVAAREWMANNGGPKTSQFVRNLLDMDHGATIDLWADRTMREATYADYKERWRILPENGKGVSDADFAFAQSAFADAAKKLGWKPSEVQGALWFLEKRRWAEEGWSPLNLGDYLPHLEELASKGSLEKELAKVPQTREKALADLKVQRKAAVEVQKKAEREAKELEVAIRKAEKAQLGFDLDIQPARR